jgi:hypothetical protein
MIFESDDEEIIEKIYKKPKLIKYSISGNIFEVPENYELKSGIGQGRI